VYSVFDSLKNKNNLFPLVIGITLVLLFSIIYIPVFASFFQVVPIGFSEIAISLFIAAVSVLWFEVYKWFKRSNV